MTPDHKMSSTTFGADLASNRQAYSWFRASNSRLQLALSDYKNMLNIEDKGGNTFSNKENPNTPAEAAP